MDEEQQRAHAHGKVLGTVIDVVQRSKRANPIIAQDEKLKIEKGSPKNQMEKVRLMQPTQRVRKKQVYMDAYVLPVMHGCGGAYYLMHMDLAAPLTCTDLVTCMASLVCLTHTQL